MSQLDFGRLGQRLELDFKVGDSEYCVDFEINGKDKSVTVGQIKKYVDRFDRVGELVPQDTKPKFYQRTQADLEEWVWS